MTIKRILIAEDDDDDFNLLNAAILSVKGSVDILRTKNGIMLSSIIETSINPDLIILDINMPYKDGVSCLRELRSKKNYDAVKIVVYSTSNSVLDINRCYAAGADLFLVKQSEYGGIIEQFKGIFDNGTFRRHFGTGNDRLAANKISLIA